MEEDCQYIKNDTTKFAPAWSASIVVAMASQNFDTPIPCCNVSPGLVSADDKSSWCQANLNTCTEVCGGQGQTSGNTCDR
ncbi:hypothetical protein HBH89_251450, partial [Parastagonospora nodorum]